MKEFLTELFSNFGIWFVKILLTAIAVLLPIHGLMGAMVTLIVIDFVTGVAASWHLKIPIKACEMKRTPIKIGLYLLCVIAAFVFETYIFSKIPVTKLTAGFIAATELKSIFENIDKIYKLNLWSYIKSVLKKFAP